MIPSENEGGQIDSNNVSAISYTEGEGEYVDTREESALFRDLESSAAAKCWITAQTCRTRSPRPMRRRHPQDADAGEIVVVRLGTRSLWESVASVDFLSSRSHCNGLKVLSVKDRVETAKFRRGTLSPP